ncbi:hypothetical protein Mapa_006393 [Marchantia paleacea]|nr:hypothetical protein Mapa_006393 [Marchantia paleacea]
MQLHIERTQGILSLGTGQLRREVEPDSVQQARPLLSSSNLPIKVTFFLPILVFLENCNHKCHMYENWAQI